MTKRILTLAALLTLAASFASAQIVTPYRGTMLRSVFSSVTADDGDVMIVTKYIGTQSSAATVAVTSATALIAFTRAGAVDTTINAGATCGAVVGTIDGTDADCNTIGEVVDMINASANWRAMPLDSLRSDATTANVFLTAGACNAKQPDGCPVRKLTATAIWNSTRAMVPCRVASCMWPGLGANTQQNPYKGTYTVLFSSMWFSTYGGGTSACEIYSVVPGTAGGAETATLLWTSASGASTVATTLGATQFPIGLIGLPDAKLVFRIQNSASMATVRNTAYGVQFRY